MRSLALASDYDGTLAEQGRVGEETRAALERLIASGVRLVLVTGRQLDDLLRVFPDAVMSDRIVAENGAVLSRPKSREVRVLAERPAQAFLDVLRTRGVDPLSTGAVVVSTTRQHEAVIRESIRDLGLALQLVFNRDSLMVLPAGVDKASGLRAALEELGLSPGSVVGVGDAENDLAFLEICGQAVAVADALPSVKERADLVTAGRNGAGVRELIRSLVAASDPNPRSTTHPPVG